MDGIGKALVKKGNDIGLAPGWSLNLLRILRGKDPVNPITGKRITRTNPYGWKRSNPAMANSMGARWNPDLGRIYQDPTKTQEALKGSPWLLGIFR